jgi:hypothetical protein
MTIVSTNLALATHLMDEAWSVTSGGAEVPEGVVLFDSQKLFGLV